MHTGFVSGVVLLIALVAANATNVFAEPLPEIELSSSDTEVSGLSSACDQYQLTFTTARYYANDAHRDAIDALGIRNKEQRSAKASKSLPVLERIRAAEFDKLRSGDGRRIVLDNDYAVLRYAAGQADYKWVANEAKKNFELLRRDARTPADGAYLLRLAIGDLGPAGAFQRTEGDLKPVLALTRQLVELLGKDPDALYFLEQYLREDLRYIDNRFDPVEKVKAALELRKLALASGSARVLYNANISLLRDLPRINAHGAASDIAAGIFEVASARLRHMRDARLRDVQRNVPSDCWTEEAAIELINLARPPKASDGDAAERYEMEALEAVLFGSLRTDVFGAAIPLAKLSAVKAASATTHRFLMRNYRLLQQDDPGEEGVPADIEMTLTAGRVFEKMLEPALAGDYYRDAYAWLDDYPYLQPQAKISVLSSLIDYEWRSGRRHRLAALFEDVDRLLERVSAPQAIPASLFQIRARYEDAQINDDLVPMAIHKAFAAGDADGLLRDHLQGMICASCTADITPLISAALDSAESQSGETDEFFLDPDFALLVLTSRPADDPLRGQVFKAVESSAGYKDWSAAFVAAGTMRDGSKLDLPKLWLAASALRYGKSAGLDELAAMLIETEAATRDRAARRLIDAMASLADEFGGYLELLTHLDDRSRLLRQAGFGGASRAVTENVARLAGPDPDHPGWIKLSDDIRLSLAAMLGSVHVRLAAYALEDKRWADSSAALDSAMSLMTSCLTQEWRFGNERAILLYRQMQPSLKLGAEIRLLLASHPEARRVVPQAKEQALMDIQFAMLSDTALSLQAAAKRRIFGDPVLASAATDQEENQDLLEQLEATEARLPSKLPWLIEEKRRAAQEAIARAAGVLKANLRVPEELGQLKGYDRSSVEAALSDDEAVVILHAGASLLFGIALRPGHEPIVYTSPIGLAALTGKISALRRDGSSFGPVDSVNAREIYELALQPAEPVLNGVRHLIVVGDGPIPATPFGMLITGNGAVAAQKDRASGRQTQRSARPIEADDGIASLESQSWLIRRYPVSIAPTLASIAIQRRISTSAATKSFLGVGDPDLKGRVQLSSVKLENIYSRGGDLNMSALESLAPLPETAAELKDLAVAFGSPLDELLLGPDATKSKLLTLRLADYRVLAFATHGILAGEINGATEPGLVLSRETGPGGESTAGYLALSDVMKLNLDADMVILSACNTGGADGRPRAEAMSGLARAFISAGARQLMVTLWSIPSEPTTRLTTGAAKRLAADGRLSWATAVQGSVLSMIDSPVTPADQHPASWAGFTVLGAGPRSR